MDSTCATQITPTVDSTPWEWAAPWTESEFQEQANHVFQLPAEETNNDE